MYHSITFYNGSSSRNTYDNFYLIGTEPPVITLPKQKTKYLDIPGADGSIDLSTTLTGGPIFEDREGSIEFYTRRFVYREVEPGVREYRSAIELYQITYKYLHGKRMKMILEDDPEYYYEGRFSVSYSPETSMNRGKVTISYRLRPYKIKCTVDGSTVTDSDPLVRSL